VSVLLSKSASIVSLLACLTGWRFTIPVAGVGATEIFFLQFSNAIEEHFSNKMITFAPQIKNNKEFMDDYHAENYNL
jgi:hypothetical protein